jgi:hypothetical protein
MDKVKMILVANNDTFNASCITNHFKIRCIIDTLKNENESESKYAKIKKFNKPNEKG